MKKNKNYDIKNDYFLIQLENLIHYKPLEDIQKLFADEEKKFDDNKIKLLLMQMGDLFRKEKLSKFFKLGYSNNLHINIFNKEDYESITVKRRIFKFCVDSERTDVIDFLINKQYFNDIDFRDVVEQSVQSEKVLKHILSKYMDKLNENLVKHMITECIHIDSSKNLKLLFETPFKIKQNLKFMNEIGFMAIKGHENEVVKTLFNKEFDYKYNLDYMFEENNSFFLTSISSRNYEAMQHLTSSYSLNYHVDVSKQIQFLKTIPHFKEIYPKLTLTKKIEEELKNVVYLKNMKH